MTTEPFQITNCTAAYAHLFSYLDGALSAEALAAMQTHLANCPPCAGEASVQKDLKAVVAKGCRTDLPDGLRDRIFGPLFTSGHVPSLTPENKIFGDD